MIRPQHNRTMCQLTPSTYSKFPFRSAFLLYKTLVIVLVVLFSGNALSGGYALQQVHFTIFFKLTTQIQIYRMLYLSWVDVQPGVAFKMTAETKHRHIGKPFGNEIG